MQRVKNVENSLIKLNRRKQLKRNLLKSQFGIKEYENGYGVTSLADPNIEYAIVTNEGVSHIYSENVVNLPEWHQTFLTLTLS